MRSLRRRGLVLPLAAALGLAGCSDSEPEPAPASVASPEAPAPKVDLPDDVELTESGTRLRIGEPATVIFAAGRGRVGSIELTVTEVVKGSMRRDFGNFGLTQDELTQEPYYVTVRVSNTGPTALGGASAPVWALDSNATYFPATSLVGDLPACRGGPLPRPFVAGDTATTCLLFVAEPGARVTEVQLRPYKGFDPVSWAVPESVEKAARRREQRERERGRVGQPHDRG